MLFDNFFNLFFIDNFMDWYLIGYCSYLCVILFGSSTGKNTYYFTATKRCDILISIDGRKVNLWLDAKRVSKAWYKKCQNNTAHELINTGTLAHKCNASIHHDFSYRTSYQFIYRKHRWIVPCKGYCRLHVVNSLF